MFVVTWTCLQSCMYIPQVAAARAGPTAILVFVANEPHSPQRQPRTSCNDKQDHHPIPPRTRLQLQGFPPPLPPFLHTMASDKRKAPDAFGSTQLIKRTKTPVTEGGPSSAVSIVGSSASNGALIQAVWIYVLFWLVGGKGVGASRLIELRGFRCRGHQLCKLLSWS